MRVGMNFERFTVNKDRLSKVTLDTAEIKGRRVKIWYKGEFYYIISLITNDQNDSIEI